MTSRKKQKLGYFHYHPASNKRLIDLFEENQKVRYEAEPGLWEETGFVQELHDSEKKARKLILQMLKKAEIETADDFFRAASFFHHSGKSQDYALAVTLFAISYHLGEEWAKNYYAVALDRYLLSINKPQYFGSQYERKNGKWSLMRYRENVSDAVRKEYYIEPLKQLKKNAENFDKPQKVRKLK